MGWLEQIFQINEGPNDWVKLNAIADWFESPCQAPLLYYAETLVPVAGRLVLMLVDTDLSDIVRECVKPCFKRAFGTKRGVGRRRGGLASVFNPPELICRKIGIKSIFEGVRVTGTTRWLWLVDTVSQEAFWYLLVADMAIDGFWYWTTVVRRSEYCRKSDRMALVASTEEMTCLAFGGLWLEAGSFNVTYRDPGIAFSGATIGLPEGHWEIGVTGNYQNAQGATGFLTLRWAGNTTIVGETVGVDPHGSARCSCIAEVDGPGFWTAQQKYIASLFCEGGTGMIWARKMWGA